MKNALIFLLLIYVLVLGVGPWWTLESAYALDNSVRVSNAYTGAMTSHPIQGGQPFVRGEILNFPRPYATPTTTGTRAAVTTWQSNVKQRWRDATVVRTITNARVGSPNWTRGGTPDITQIQVVNGVATATWPIGTPHGLAIGDRLVVDNTPSTADNPAFLDNLVVYDVPTSLTAKYLSRFNVGGVYQATASTVTYTGSGITAITVDQKIDPLEAATTCRYYSADHGFMKGETVTIASVGGITPSSATQAITGVTKNEFVTNATCSGTYTSGGTATGPDNGSVRFAVWAAFVTVPAATDTVRIDFVNDTNQCSSGDDAACRTAGFSKTEMLAATWNFDLVATADVKSGATAAITTSARTMLTAWNEVESYCGPRYWAYGPVLTWFILEHGCALTDTAATTDVAALPGAVDAALPYDFGWKIRPGPTVSTSIAAGDVQFHVSTAANVEAGTTLWIKASTGAVETATVGGKFDADSVTTCNGVAISTGSCLTGVTRAVTGAAAAYASGRGLGVKQWEDATTAYKSLHPRFDLTFYASGGWGVKGSVMVANSWIDKSQNIWYSIDIKTGGTPASAFTKTAFKHNNSTSWRVDLYDGTDAEFYCATAGTMPLCAGGTRTRRYLIDHNTPYLEHTGIIPEWKLYTGQATALNAKRTGFKSGDMGAIVAGTGLGQGTFGAQPGATGSTAEKSDAAMQEAFVLTDVQAMCLQNWSAACYDINFGDSAPGGGGNVEAQRHIPYHYREDDATNPRPFYAGFPDLAFGRAISQYARPTFVASTASADSGTPDHHPLWDIRHDACSASAPATPADNGTGTGDTTSTRGWPCHWLFVGLDGWALDTTHQNQWQDFAYMITGDPRYLDGITNMASWNLFQEMTSRADGRSWMQPDVGVTALRSQGGRVQAVLSAAIWTPNVPLFGATVPSAEVAYWNEKAWDMGYAKEGFFGIDGYFKTHYPHMDIVDPCTNQPANSIYKFTRCTAAAGKSNPLGQPGHNVSTTCGVDTHAWTNCAVSSYREEGLWYAMHTISQWHRANALGMTMFEYPRRRFARFAFALWNSTHFNPWMLDLYQLPAKIGSEYLQSLTEMYDGLNITWNDGVAGSRADTDWCHSALTCNQTNLSYQTQWWPPISGFKDLRTTVYSDIDGCTGTNCSWDNTKAFMDTNMSMYSDIVKFGILPHSKLYDLSCTPGSITASCTYTPPDANACKYLVGTSAPADSLDASYTTDGGTTTSLRTLNLSSLTVNQSYRLTVQCGQVVSGVADGTSRTVSTFSTQGSSGGSGGKSLFKGKATLK